MRFKSATIKNFRRFTDLTIGAIPPSVRLIMLAGPNGCGKSSFFDALYTWYAWTSKKNRSWEMDYHAKVGSPLRNQPSDDVLPQFHDPIAGDRKNLLYVRSAYRNDPEFQMNQLQRTGRLVDETRIRRMIDNDATVSRNYQRLASKGLEDLYENGAGETTFDRYRQESIGDIARAFRRLFPAVKLHSLGNPVANGTFRFTKGDSRGFVFKNLSGGEKAAFDLILDLVVAKREYNNTLYCIDEPESHLSARLQAELLWVRLFFVEEFLPYSWAFLPADASLQCSVRGDSNQASAYPRLSGAQPSLETVPNTVGLSPSGALPSGHSRGVLVRFHGQGDRPVMAVTTGFQGRRFDVPEARTGVPRIDLPSPAPCAAADAVFADAKAFLSSNEARQMSESELERELHRRGQDLVRRLLQGHRDQRSPKEAAGPAEDTSGVECSEPHEHESHAETTSGTMQVVGLGCARRGHDGLHPLDAALNLLPERSLVDMRRRVTIATASRAPPRTPWKPQWYSTLSTWQRRCGVRCSSPAH